MKNHKSSIYLLVTLSSLFLANGLCLAQSSTVFKSAHFKFILHDTLEVSDVAHLERALEENYDRILKDLHVSSLPIITVQIWADEAHYQDAMEETLGSRFPGSRGYITGDRELRLLYHRRLSAQKEAVHEFVHVVSLNINSEFGNNPRWLWEAVAQYEAEEFVDPNTVDYLRNGNYPTLAELNEGFNTGRNIYDVGYVLVEYIISKWGTASIVALIRTNGALEKVLDVDASAFEKGWQKYIKEKYLKN